MIQSRQTNIDKYLYLSTIKGQNTDLFYRLLIDKIRDLMPIVYTPTIGDVCLQYSTLYTRPEALYISIKQQKSIRTMLRNWPCPNPEICVVTDGSRILGLGDLGVNGVGISVSLDNLPVLLPPSAAKSLTRQLPDWQTGALHGGCWHPSRQDASHRLGLRHRQRDQPQGPPVPGPAAEACLPERPARIHGRVHGGGQGRVSRNGCSV